MSWEFCTKLCGINACCVYHMILKSIFVIEAGDLSDYIIRLFLPVSKEQDIIFLTEFNRQSFIIFVERTKYE